VIPNCNVWAKVAWIAAVAGLVLAGCGPKNARDASVDELEGALDSVRMARAALMELPADSIAQAKSWSEQHLWDFELLVSDSTAQLTREEGAIISEVARARRLLKDGPERLRTLAESGERTESQLVALISALESGATTDGAGTPIDSAYIATNTARELSFARAYLVSVAETQDLARRGLDIAAAAAAPVDSLKTVLRARYAAALIASSEE
jgi:hypothetical protein